MRAVLSTALRWTLCATISLAAPIPVKAQSLSAIDPPLTQRASALRPGEYLWDEAATYGGPLSIVISIGQQRAYVYRGASVIAVAAVSTGKAGHATPVGSYSILQKRAKHFSNLYANAPMPFMQRLTWDGIALHAGRDPGFPNSHGCVRLPYSFAARLFAATRLGQPVIVTEYDIDPPFLLTDRRVFRDDGVLPMPALAMATASAPGIEAAPWLALDRSIFLYY